MEIHLQLRITETECTVYQLIIIRKGNKKGSKLSREEVVFKTSEKQISWSIRVDYWELKTLNLNSSVFTLKSKR